MLEQCRVADAERAHDVEYIEPIRPKAIFTGLEAFNLDHQKLLLKYASDELTEYQERRLIFKMDKLNGKHNALPDNQLFVIHEAMQNISRVYIVDYLTPLFEKHGEDWLFENYGVYEPEEV